MHKHYFINHHTTPNESKAKNKKGDLVLEAIKRTKLKKKTDIAMAPTPKGKEPC